MVRVSIDAHQLNLKRPVNEQSSSIDLEAVAPKRRSACLSIDARRQNTGGPDNEHSGSTEIVAAVKLRSIGLSNPVDWSQAEETNNGLGQ